MGCDARSFGVDADVLQNLVDVGAERDERDDAHLAAAHRAQRREHLVDFTRILVGLQGLCVPFATAVNQISAALLEPDAGLRMAALTRPSP